MVVFDGIDLLNERAFVMVSAAIWCNKSEKQSSDFCEFCVILWASCSSCDAQVSIGLVSWGFRQPSQ